MVVQSGAYVQFERNKQYLMGKKKKKSSDKHAALVDDVIPVMCKIVFSK